MRCEARPLVLVWLALAAGPLAASGAGAPSSTVPDAPSPAALELELQSLVFQGCPLAGRIGAAVPLDPRVDLYLPGSGLASPAVVWPLGRQGGVWRYSFLAAIPRDARAGLANLVVTAAVRLPDAGSGAGAVSSGAPPAIFPAWRAAPGQLLQASARLEIRSGRYRQELIALDPLMDRLRNAPDPRRDAQIRRYAAVLARADPGALFLGGQLAGSFRRPVASLRRTAWFGDLRVYRSPDGSRETGYHFGVDYGVPAGTPVSAPAGARVVLAENRITTGWTVILEHLPGVFTIYMHLSRLEVREGQTVGAGQLLGASGATGFATGPHLHWEMRIRGVACDPEALLAPDWH